MMNLNENGLPVVRLPAAHLVLDSGTTACGREFLLTMRAFTGRETPGPKCKACIKAALAVRAKQVTK